MTYEYEETIKEELEFTDLDNTDNKDKMLKKLQEVYRKAQAFDNYMVDLAKTIETFPHDYIKNDNFAKETYEFYMKSKEDFIKSYENEVGRKYELIRDVAEYDRILSDLEDE